MFVYVINEVFVFIDNRYHLVEEKSSFLYKSRVCKGYLQSGQNHSNSCLTSKMKFLSDWISNKIQSYLVISKLIGLTIITYNNRNKLNENLSIWTDILLWEVNILR